MKNRSSYAVLTRFGIIAAILATLVFIAPAATAQSECELDDGTLECTYPEKGTDSVTTLTASDEDEDAGDVEWSLDGVDKGAFKISDDGVLTFDKSPNFESPTDADEDTAASGDQGKGDNVYKVTVVATSDTKTELKVEVTVTDIEEEGEVTFDQPQPQATRGLVASVSDGDGEITNRQWQWSKSMDMENWTDIEGATSASRSPAAADVGYYLRATVTYTDRRGPDKTASGVTANKVEARTLANAAPSFGDIDPIPVDENVKGNIGDPIVANDADNDVLLYSLDAAYDANAGTDGAQNDNGLFDMSKDGQLSLKAGLDYESPGDDPATGSARVANAVTTDDIPDGVFVYRVGIKALDPSGAPGTAVVMVHLSDVNEAPKFSDATEAGDAGHPTNANKLYITENQTSVTTTTLSLRSTSAVPTSAETISYSAADNDGTTKDTAVSYKVEGADAKYFTFADPTTGTLTPTTELSAEGAGANFEKKPSYSITIVASTSGAGGDGNNPTSVTMYARLDVTVMVEDAEDPGEVELSARQSQVNIPVIAKLSDPDGDETAVTWKWFRGSSTTPILSDAGVLDTTADTECDADADPPVHASDTVICRIGGQTSALYTPGDDDVGHIIHAVANYKDGQGSVAENALGSSEASVQDSNPGNTAPKFPDQDLNTAGDQSDTAMRSVPENFKGKVGEPIGAVDADVDTPEGNMELLTYTIDDEDNFSVDRKTGQLSTAVKLDYEALPDDAKYYMVVLTATDPSGAQDSITVQINVTDEDDPPTITLAEEMTGECNDDYECTYPEKGTGPVATFSGSDEDEGAGDVDWSLDGVDKGAFKISDDGVLTFDKSPNFESPTDADEDTAASGDQGKGDNVYKVTVVATSDTKTELKVEVTVTDIEEEGEVTFDQPQPQATRGLVASVSDGDGEIIDRQWQWSKSMDMENWTDIEGATSASRSPAAADVGYYLRATVTYTDRRGPDKTASGVTANKVEARTLANAAPSFGDIDPIPVDENVKGNIGDPIVANDADNDVLLYSLDAAYDANAGTDGAQNDNGLFDMSKDGQLSLKAGLDYESPGDDPATGSARVANAVTTDDIPDGVFVYRVGIKALDPSGAPGTAVVMVHLSDVNEAPKFSDATEAGDAGHPTNANKLYITENQTSVTTTTLSLRSTSAVPTSAETISYSAADNDGTTKDTAVSYKVEGADAKYFTFADPTTGTLTPTTELSAEGAGANFEKKPSYSITIVASTSGAGGDGNNPTSVTMYARLDVTVMVEDAEDPGEVELSARQSQVNIPVIAKLSDPDGDETAVTWKWFRGSSTTPILSDAGVLDTTADTECDADADPPVDASDTVICRIGGQTSALYTPGDDDVGHIIHAVANYKDGQGSVAENALGSSEASVQDSNPGNTAPKFPDQDLNTAGDQSDTAMRSVPENFKGKVGEPIGAVDADVDTPEGNMELLTYTIDDEDNFSVDRKTGQLSTAVKLDYEALPDDAKYYMVVLTATDPSGAQDSITVQINVTDEDDPPVITLGGAPAPAPDPAGPDCMSAAGGVSSLAPDCQTLLNIMDELIGGGTADLNWSVDTPMSDWEGIAGTATGRVTRIHLRGAGLAGVLPAGITALNALERLTLTDNDLTGDIPDLSGLDSIDWLVLGGNAFTGGIPASLGDLGSLRRLWLHRNDGGFEGGIPAELGSLPRLRYLMLYGNDLAGGIPASLGDATNLKALYLHDNMLSGSIPASLGSLMTEADDTLRLLYLHNNMLSGAIPAELGNLTSLERILLAGNDDLSGCIPAAIIDAAADADMAGLMACPAEDES